jgi:hypothetical protein
LCQRTLSFSYTAFVRLTSADSSQRTRLIIWIERFAQNISMVSSSATPRFRCETLTLRFHSIATTNACRCTRNQCIASQLPPRRYKMPGRRPTRINYVCTSGKLTMRRVTVRSVEIAYRALIRSKSWRSKIGVRMTLHWFIRPSKQVRRS